MEFDTANHFPQDLQSLLMHEEAVSMLRASPALAQRALTLLDRWDVSRGAESQSLRAEWREIVTSRDWERAVARTERSAQLRQASPLSCLLPNSVRLSIIRKIRHLKEATHEAA